MQLKIKFGSKRFFFLKKPTDRKVVFSYFITRPSKGKIESYLTLEEKKILIAEFNPIAQRSFSYNLDGVQVDVDTLIFSKEEHRDVLELEVISEFFDEIILVDSIEISRNIKILNSSQVDSNFFSNYKNYHSQYLIRHQDADRICMPVSIANSLGVIFDKLIDPFELLDLTYDYSENIYGNWSFATYAAYNKTSGAFKLIIRFVHSLECLKELLKFKMPVIVSIQGEIPGGYKVFSSGHLIAVVGINDEEVITLDSASDSHEGVKKTYKKENFLKAWNRRNKLAFIFQKKYDSLL